MVIVACVKQVPDTTDVRIDPVTNTLMRQGVPSILNPYDAHAAEEAVRLKERYGGRVIALSMGPPQAAEVLRKCISLGVDRGVLLSDRVFAGSDTWATSYTLAAAVRRVAEVEGTVDLVLCGKQAIDGDTAQVGPGLAQRLDFSQITYAVAVEEVDLKAHRLRVMRRLENGVETVETALPAVVTCNEEINELRYATLPNMIRAARYVPETWTRADLEADDDLLGMKGSPTAVSKVFPPPLREPGEIIAGPGTDPQVAADAVIRRLVAAAQSLHA